MTPASLHSFSAPAMPPSHSQADDLYLGLLEFVRQQMPELAAYVEQNAVTIVASFKELASQSLHHSEQMQQVMQLSRRLTIDGQTQAGESSIEQLYAPMADAIDTVVSVSGMAMEMMQTIGRAADNITRMEQCLTQVQQITKQTNMLAMNTQIEAARAGEAGKSFRIIAQEVKQLSEHIKHLSRQMQEDVSQVARSVRQSTEAVDHLAHYDLSDNLQLKDRLGQLMQSVMDQNARFAELIEDSAANARKTAESISQLVVGIQFQDRNSQTMADLSALLGQILAHWWDGESPRPLPGPDAAERLAAEVLNVLKLSEIRRKALESLAQQQIIPPQPEAAGNGHADGGDIELF